jgi:glycine cleavage system regulatory protein
MSPFGNYRHIVPASARRCPSGRCTVCASQPAQLRQEFTAVVSESWSPAEIDLLSQAARSALL